jgi:hypothetical protein
LRLRANGAKEPTEAASRHKDAPATAPPRSLIDTSVRFKTDPCADCRGKIRTSAATIGTAMNPSEAAGQKKSPANAGLFR